MSVDKRISWYFRVPCLQVWSFSGNKCHWIQGQVCRWHKLYYVMCKKTGCNIFIFHCWESFLWEVYQVSSCEQGNFHNWVGVLSLYYFRRNVCFCSVFWLQNFKFFSSCDLFMKKLMALFCWLKDSFFWDLYINLKTYYFSLVLFEDNRFEVSILSNNITSPYLSRPLGGVGSGSILNYKVYRLNP